MFGASVFFGSWFQGRVWGLFGTEVSGLGLGFRVRLGLKSWRLGFWVSFGGLSYGKG